MPCLSIQARRPGISSSPFMTGRLGLTPPNASERPASPSTSLSAGMRCASLRSVVTKSGGTRWPWVSMIIRTSSAQLSLLMAVPDDLALVHRLRDHIPELDDRDRHCTHHETQAA